MNIADGIDIHKGDCIDVMQTFPENAFETLITDPPAGINFMAKAWDDLSGYHARTERGNQVSEALKSLVEMSILEKWEAGFLLFTVDWAYSALRVLKPGASGLVWALPRTSDLTKFGLRLAGFEVRDDIAHLFSVGFPKSHDISKNIDKHLGKERKPSGTYGDCGYKSSGGSQAMGVESGYKDTAFSGIRKDIPASKEAEKWQGWGTALKPAREDWILVRKPLDGTNAENALKWGVAGLNIDGGSIPVGDGEKVTINRWDDGAKPFGGGAGHPYTGTEIDSRWPANVTHGGLSDENLRYFYGAKANTIERDAGLDEIEPDYKAGAHFRPNHFEKAQEGDTGNPYGRWGKIKNNHPTVKSIALMEYLCKLTMTPDGGVVLDPFMGSGSTGIGCILTGRGFVGIDREDKYIEISKRRLKFWVKWVVKGLTDSEQILRVSQSEREQKEQLEQQGLAQNTLFD